MIQKLDAIKESAFKISPYELNLYPNDTLVLQFDLEIFDLEEISQILKQMKKVYPQNKIIATFKGEEIKGIIHEKNKYNKSF